MPSSTPSIPYIPLLPCSDHPSSTSFPTPSPVLSAPHPLVHTVLHDEEEERLLTADAGALPALRTLPAGLLWEQQASLVQTTSCDNRGEVQPFSASNLYLHIFFQYLFMVDHWLISFPSINLGRTSTNYKPKCSESKHLERYELLYVVKLLPQVILAAGGGKCRW